MTKSDAPLIVGVSGLRGIVGESLTPEVAVRFAGAFGGWLRETRGYARVVVGHDGRAGGEVIYSAAKSALMWSGIEVVEAGRCTTPGLATAVDSTDADGGLMVTASHNPQPWNGLKLMTNEPYEERGGACAPPKRIADEIIARFAEGETAWVAWHELGEATIVDDVNESHARSVWYATDPSIDDGDSEDRPQHHVMLDSVNCGGGESAGAMLRMLGHRATQLFGDDSGRFPHTPEPTAENLSGEGGLCDAVPGLKADVGFAQDPDADRLAIVDENGRYIGEEYTLVIAAEALLSARERSDEKPVMVVNLSTSRMIEDVAAKHGAEVVRTPVGEANVVERMKALMEEGREVILGGEGNGGVIWPEVCFVRDSLSAMALTLSSMARTGKTVSEIVALIDSYSEGGKGYAIVKRKTEIASKADAKPACDKVEKAYASERVDTQDGVRVDFSGARAGCWVHVRASNTEPIMRLICEAPTEGLANEILAEVEGVIAGG
ncbi:MAG: phosphoglucosamine mutase [Planctomycetota bacterium]